MKRKLVQLCAVSLVGVGALGVQTASAQQVDWVQPVSKIHPGALGVVMAQKVQLATDNNGTVLCLYQASQAGIRSASSSTNGTSWNPGFVVIFQGNYTNPAVATDTQGNWLALANEPADTSNAALYSLSTDNGASWSTPGFIADTIFPGSTLGAATAISLASGSQGLWVAALKTTVDSRQIIAIIKSDNNGATWQPVTMVENARDVSNVDIKANNSGEFMVVYETTLVGEGQDTSDIAYIRLDAQANVQNQGPVGPDAANDTILDVHPSVASTSDGSWVVGWAGLSGSNWDVVVSSSANGATWTNRTPITPQTHTKFGANDLADPAIASGLNDRLLALWSSLSTPPIDRVMYSSLQTSPQDLESVTPSTVDMNWNGKLAYAPAVIQAAGGRWVAAWQDAPGTPTPTVTPWFTHGIESGTVAGDTPTDADLEITKTVYPESIVAGNKLGYVITVRNLETTVPANLVKIQDVLPGAFEFEHAVISQGTWSLAGSTVNANVGTINPGSKVTLSIAMTAQGTIGQTVTNTATTTLLGTDPNVGNNASSANVTITEGTTDPGDPGDPDPPTTPSLSLALTKVTVSGKEPKPGKPAKPYKIKVKTAATNISQAVTTPTVVMLYLSDDATLDDADTLIAQKALKAIKPGKAKKANLSAKIAGNPSGKYLIAVIPGEAREVFLLP